MSDQGDVIFRAPMDNNTWLVLVTGITESQGELTITKIGDGEVILTERVGLMYGAIFGPDIDDVRTWERMAVEAVDSYNAKKEEVT
jgi:hypothetical protein